MFWIFVRPQGNKLCFIEKHCALQIVSEAPRGPELKTALALVCM